MICLENRIRHLIHQMYILLSYNIIIIHQMMTTTNVPTHFFALKNVNGH